MNQGDQHVKDRVRIRVTRGAALVARALVFHEAVAERLGINATDLKCLELAVGEDDDHPDPPGRAQRT